MCVSTVAGLRGGRTRHSARRPTWPPWRRDARAGRPRWRLGSAAGPLAAPRGKERRARTDVRRVPSPRRPRAGERAGRGHGLVRRGRALGHGLVRRGRDLGHGLVRRGCDVGHDLVRHGRDLGHGLVRRGRALAHGLVRRGRAFGHVLVLRGRALAHGLVRHGRARAQGLAEDAPFTTALSADNDNNLRIITVPMHPDLVAQVQEQQKRCWWRGAVARWPQQLIAHYDCGAVAHQQITQNKANQIKVSIAVGLDQKQNCQLSQVLAPATTSH